MRGGPNFYTYVGNNPVNFVDPFGLSPECREQAKKDLNRCRLFSGFITAFSGGNLIAACGVAGFFTAGFTIPPCVGAATKITFAVGGVLQGSCYLNYLNKLDKCCSDPCPDDDKPRCQPCDSGFSGG